MVRFPYRPGDLQPAGPVETIVTGSRRAGIRRAEVVFSTDGARMFVSELLSNQIEHKLFGCLTNQLLSNFLKFIMSVFGYYLGR